MTADRDEANLKYILDTTRDIQKHFALLAAGELWHENVTVKHAVLYALHTISESCGNLSDEMKAKAPEMKWKRIKGFRNVLVHEYLGSIDYERVTNVIQQFLPELNNVANKLYEEYYGDRH